MSINRIKEIREYLKLSQAELAEKINFSQAKIAAMETAKNKISPEVALKLLQLFGINTDYTLYGKIPMLAKDKEIKSLNQLKINYDLTDDEIEFLSELLNNKAKRQAIMTSVKLIKSN